MSAYDIYKQEVLKSSPILIFEEEVLFDLLSAMGEKKSGRGLRPGHSYVMF